jgi:hypothetical protein
MAFRGGHSYTIYAPANPTDPGDAADPSTPQGILKFHRRIRITIRTTTGKAFYFLLRSLLRAAR